jgi:transcription elongation GreA/GreB family factor
MATLPTVRDAVAADTKRVSIVGVEEVDVDRNQISLMPISRGRMRTM